MAGEVMALSRAMLEPGEAAALQVITTASVGLWGIVMALYVFVFRYFQEKPEKEKFRRGRQYWTYFVQIIYFSVTTLIAISTAVLALAVTPDGSRERILLLLALGAFLSNLVSSVVFVAKEIRTSMKFVEPYAIPHFLVEALSKKYLKSVKKEVSKVTGREATENFIKRVMDKFLEDIEKGAFDADSESESRSKK